MAANEEGSVPVKGVQVWFQPSASGCFTGADVVTVEYRGARRLVHRVGTIRLGIGRRDLVGLAPSEVTWVLVDALHAWLSQERGMLHDLAEQSARRAAPPAPPEGVTGAAWNPLKNVALPRL